MLNSKESLETFCIVSHKKATKQISCQSNFIRTYHLILNAKFKHTSGEDIIEKVIRINNFSCRSLPSFPHTKSYMYNIYRLFNQMTFSTVLTILQ